MQNFALQEENTNLKKKVQSLEHELQSANKLHLNSKNQLEDELLGLRKKLRDAEAKYTNLASTPPKVSLHVLVVTSELSVYVLGPDPGDLTTWRISACLGVGGGLVLWGAATGLKSQPGF